MTNQTINGVPRGVLSDAFDELPDWNTPAATKLRAMLDAERCTSCDGSGDLIDLIGEWRGYCVCPAGVALKNKPAAQPQSVPVAGPNNSAPNVEFVGYGGLTPKGSAKLTYRAAVWCQNCGDSKTIILAHDDNGMLIGPCPHCLPKPPPAGSDRISMEGAMIFCGGAPNPITYTGNGAIVNLDGYVLYAPGAEPVAVVMPDLWQPIETAPKDGTEIILRKGDRVTSGAWTDWSKAEAEFHGSTGAYLGQVEYDSGSLWASWDGGFCDDDHPTHWQPLPTVTPQQ